MYAEKNPDKIKKTTDDEMRLHCQRPGKVDEDGNILYTTEQFHKKECDVNEIIKKYDKTGLISHISGFEAEFGDMTGHDFKQAQDLILGAQAQFNQLPAEIRKRFDNSPENLLEFMEHEENRAEAIELGLINEKWTPETDGLGEHVKKGENIETEGE